MTQSLIFPLLVLNVVNLFFFMHHFNGSEKAACLRTYALA